MWCAMQLDAVRLTPFLRITDYTKESEHYVPQWKCVWPTNDTHEKGGERGKGRAQTKTNKKMSSIKTTAVFNVAIVSIDDQFIK